MIKGWLDAAGQTHEHVYDVVWSGNRKIDAKGKLPAVGNTVDVKSAKYTNTIGAAQLATVWTNPDFNPAQRAFYVRASKPDAASFPYDAARWESM